MPFRCLSYQQTQALTGTLTIYQTVYQTVSLRGWVNKWLAEALAACALTGLLLPLQPGRRRHRGEQEMPEAELDLRLHRLLFFSDGVYAIAVTLLAVELVLPEAAADLHGRDLLQSLLESWPRVLAFFTSFLFIANFWAGHNIIFRRVRRFDGGLMWLALLQLLCIAFPPFPTSVVGEHASDPVAQQFYVGSLLLTGLVMWALWWYMSSGHRLVDPDFSPRAIRRHHLISAGVLASVLFLMVLVALGAGQLINPLLLAFLVAFGYVVLGVLEQRESLPAEVEAPGGSDDAGSHDEGESKGPGHASC
jgi:uncharacterized membrane protein